MNIKRKYFRSSIHELREICNTQKNNDSVLKDVFDELQHRKTRGAVELRDKLETYLNKSSDTKKTKPSSNKKKTSNTKTAIEINTTTAKKTKTPTKSKGSI